MKKIALLTAMLIIGSLQCQAHECPCKPKITHEQKEAKKEKHKRAKEKVKTIQEQQRLLDKCYSTVYWSPDTDGHTAKIKRDSNGDRV
jgi:hypothetical protein